MPERTRRAVLALGLGAAGTLAGCIGGNRTGGSPSPEDTPEDGSTPTDPRGTADLASLSIDHAGEFHRLDAGFPQRDVASYYLALLRTGTHAEEFPTVALDDEDAEQFVTNTDFSRSVVVVLQDRAGSSHPDLELVETGRDGRQITVEAEYPGRSATADVTTDTLLVRAPAEDPVRSARATIHPMGG